MWHGVGYCCAWYTNSKTPLVHKISHAVLGIECISIVYGVRMILMDLLELVALAAPMISYTGINRMSPNLLLNLDLLQTA